MCAALFLSWAEPVLPLAAPLCLSDREAESQSSDLLCYESVAPNCIKCIMGGNLYVQCQEIQCQGYHGNCMHSEKLMNGF